MAQPIIRGIQAVGAVSIFYTYNSSDGILTLPSNLIKNSLDISDNRDSDDDVGTIDTSSGVPVTGFRLDGEFLRATQQIASSVMVPLLGGGALALTNNNRSGTLTVNCTRATTPDADYSALSGSNVGIFASDTSDSTTTYYDLVTLAQAQQAQYGGDDVGSTITVEFTFNGRTTQLEFQGCTIATVDPVGLAGNDAVNYNVVINYLNWTITYNLSSSTTGTQTNTSGGESEGESGGESGGDS